MASGTYNLSLEHPSSSVSFQGKLEWTSTSNGTTANSSLVEVKLYARKQGSSSATSGTFKGSITIDGTKTTFSQSKSVQNSWVLISTSSKTVSHNADGTKSITIAGEVGKVSGTTLANINSTGSTSITLDTIPRYATIYSPNSPTDEGSFGFFYSNPAGEQVTTLQACVSLDGTTATIPYQDVPKTGSSSFVMNMTTANRNTLRNAFTTSNSGTIWYILKTTLNGNTNYDKVSVTMTIINANPVFTTSNLGYQDTIASVIAVTGDNQKLVAQNSKVQINWTSPTLLKGATFKNIKFTFGGLIINPAYTSTSASGSYLATGGLLGNINVTAVVTDSRNNTTSVNLPIPVIPYNKPVINVTAERLNNYEDTTYLTPNVTIASVDNLNSLQSLKYKYREASSQTYGSWYTINNGATATLNLDKEKEWVIWVEAEDSFKISATTIGVNKGVFPLFIDTALNSVGINTFPVGTETLETGGDTTIGGDLEVKGDLVLRNQSIFSASISSDTSLTNTNEKALVLAEGTYIGDKLSLNSAGGMVIGSGVDYVMVSAKVNYTTLSSTAYMRYARIKVNGVDTIDARNHVPANCTYGVNLSIPPQLLKVQQGDVITLAVQGTNGDVVKSKEMWTNLTIEVLSYKE